jgi:tRNA-Thr(GGU) m(6)t(6)A37 methyltransferase TsaA
MSDIVSYAPIGVVRTPHTDLADMPIQPAGARGVRGTVEIAPRYAEALRDLDGFSHLVLLYHFHAAGSVKLTVKPFLDSEPRGLFATRAPSRPNPIGLSVVRLVEVAGNVLTVEDVDILDGTPLLDLKPYVPEFDSPPDVRLGWLAGKIDSTGEARSDGRFRG